MKKELIKYQSIDDAYIAYKKKPAVNTYDKLVQELKFYKIDPKECFDIVYKTKYQYNTRYHWTLARISFYLLERWRELEDIAKNNGLGNFDSYSKRKPGPLVFREYIETVINNKKIIELKNKKKLFSRNSDICRKIAKSDIYKTVFKFHYPKEKIDFRKDAQNLQKLVSEQKHRKKFIKKKWRLLREEIEKKSEKEKLRFWRTGELGYAQLIWHLFTQNHIDFLINS